MTDEEILQLQRNLQEMGLSLVIGQEIKFVVEDAYKFAGHYLSAIGIKP